MDIQFLKAENHDDLAYVHTPPEETKGQGRPYVMFLPGFRSDMDGTKAIYLEEACQKRGQGFIRFDYSGHGRSGGEFAAGTIGRWKEDARAILDHLLPEGRKVVLVGSSMGGWIALLLAKECPEKLAGLVGLAAAPDFTLEIEAEMSAAQKQEMAANGLISVPNDYSDEPYIFTKALIYDGRENLFLNGTVYDFPFPVRLIQGMKDTDVEWQTAHRIKNALSGDVDADVLLIEEGDHRLSRPQDLELIDAQVQKISGL